MLRHLQTFVYKFRNILLKIKFKIVFFAYKSKDFFVIFLSFGNISFVLFTIWQYFLSASRVGVFSHFLFSGVFLLN